MNNDRKTILKQLLSGQITGKDALQRLNTKPDDLTVIMKHSDGSYSIGTRTGLTEEEIKTWPKSDFYLMVGDDPVSYSIVESITGIKSPYSS